MAYDRSWADSIRKEANGLPVTFFGAFQQASIYDYYSKERSRTYSSLNTRKTQYDLWQESDNVLTNTMLVLNWEGKNANKLESDQGTIYYLKDSIYYLNRMKMELSQEGDSLKVNLRSFVSEELRPKLRLEFMVFEGKDLKHKEFVNRDKVLKLYESGSIALPLDQGIVKKGDIIRIGFKYSWIPSSNSIPYLRYSNPSDKSHVFVII